MLIQLGETAVTYTTIEPIVGRLLSLLEEKLVVLIGGAPHAGKSTLSQKLAEALTRESVPVTAFSYDGWLMGVNRTPPGVTVPVMEEIDTIGLKKAVDELISNGVIRPPVYDIRTMCHVEDEGDPVFFEKGVLILDGSFILLIEGLRKMREIASLNIYVDRSWHEREKFLRLCYSGFCELSPDEYEPKLAHDKTKTAPAMRSAKFADLIYRPASRGLADCYHK